MPGESCLFHVACRLGGAMPKVCAVPVSVRNSSTRAVPYNNNNFEFVTDAESRDRPFGVRRGCNPLFPQTTPAARRQKFTRILYICVQLDVT
jgi:hypothetical protein